MDLTHHWGSPVKLAHSSSMSLASRGAVGHKQPVMPAERHGFSSGRYNHLSPLPCLILDGIDSRALMITE
jgi:hypothetical protein